MITSATATAFRLTCDPCSKAFSEGDEDAELFLNEEVMLDLAYDRDWDVEGDTHRCPDCIPSARDEIHNDNIMRGITPEAMG